jgi:hypothetical protein
MGSLLPEESADVIMETVNGRGAQFTKWMVAKRGTIFTEGALPPDNAVKWFKDVTHVYRVKSTGRKRGRREWGTTLWIDGTPTQQPLSHKKVRAPFCLFKRLLKLFYREQEAVYTREYYAQTGCDSIHWAQVEALRNRTVNPESGVQYPLVSEELWMKHVGSKRIGAPALAPADNSMAMRRWIRQVTKYACVLDDDEVADRALEAANLLARTTRTLVVDDERFRIPVVVQRRKTKKKSSRP